MKLPYILIALMLVMAIGYSIKFNNSCLQDTNVSFDNRGSSETLINFPVLLVVNSSWLNTSGAVVSENIQIFDSNGTLLGRETELWNSLSNSYIWTNVPRIDAGVNTSYINVEYNCDANTTNTLPIWNSNYTNVYHLNETSGTVFYDLSINKNNLTRTTAGNEIFNTTSLIGNGHGFFGTDYRSTNNVGNPIGTSIDASDNMTFSMWVNVAIIGGTANGTGGWGETVGVGGANRYQFSTNYPVASKWGQFGGGSGDIDSTIPTIVGNWSYLTATYNGTEFRFYVNGILGSANVVTFNINANPLRLGWTGYGSTNYYSGTIDEVRIQNITRSSLWINSTYLSEINKFQLYGNIISDFPVPIPPVTIPSSSNICISNTTLMVNYTSTLNVNGNIKNITLSENINCPYGCFNDECAPSTQTQYSTILIILVLIVVALWIYKRVRL